MSQTEQFQINDRVIVNTGGADARGVVMQLNKRLGVRVAFENGTSQWMSPHHMRADLGAQ